MLVEGGASGVLLASRSGRVVRDGQGLEAQLRSMSSVTAAVMSDSADAQDASALLALRVLRLLVHIRDQRLHHLLLPVDGA